MDSDQTPIPLTERKVVRRGMLAGLAGFGALALMHVKGSPSAEALDPQDIDMNTTNNSSAGTILNSAAAGGSGYTVLKVENFRIADAIEAQGGPGSLGNAGGRGINATGGSNTLGSFALPSNAGDAILGTGGTTTGAGGGGVGNGGKGVRGLGGAAGTGTGGTGVEGSGGSPGGIGVRGFGGGTSGSQGNGVFGSTNSTANAAVRGQNTGGGDGVLGQSTGGAGLRGTSTAFVGIVGISSTSHGLYGSTNGGAGVYGIVAENLGADGPGLLVTGWTPSQIYGGLQVFGAKNAVLKMQDGTFAAVYCQESPEPYFEDFGRAQLVGGVANVAIEREFATLVAGGDYMVFAHPEGDTRGLYVSRRTPGGFEVREVQGGTGNVPFTYRIVTRRKDIDGKRFARVDTSAAANVAGVRAALAAMPTAGISPTTPNQPIVPPTNTTTPPPVVTGGPGSTIAPGAGPSSAPPTAGR